MGEGDTFVCAVVGFFAGIGLFFNGFRWFKQKRLIENIPTSKVRSIAMGLTEVYGEIVPAMKKILKSPFSNKDCVYYKYSIEEYRSNGKRSSWVTVKQSTVSVPFFLKDNTGKVLVDPKGATISLVQDHIFNSRTGKKVPANVEVFLRSNKLTSTSFFGFNKTMRYRESFLEPKDKVYVLGTAGDNPYVKDGSSQKNEDDIMIKNGKPLYYISDKGEKDVINSFKWKVAGGIYGGAALTIGCLSFILFYLGLF